jgi:hypothetical protein
LVWLEVEKDLLAAQAVILLVMAAVMAAIHLEGVKPLAAVLAAMLVTVVIMLREQLKTAAQVLVVLAVLAQ